MAENGETVANGAPAADAAPAMEYNLLPRLIPHLDRHLVYPILDWMSHQENQDPIEVKKLMFQLLNETNMIDYLGGLDMDIRGVDQPSGELETRREQLAQRREHLEEATAKISEIMSNPDITNNLRADKVANLNYLKENHGVTAEDIQAVYDYSQFLYSEGDYDRAGGMLLDYRVLGPDDARMSNAMWGIFACEILQQKFDTAMPEVDRIKENIDTRLFNSPLAQLQQRTWLLHWCLFPLFQHEPARDSLIELFFSPSYINTIQTSCPWILRYLAVAVISGRSTSGSGTKNLSGGGSAYQKQLKDLVRIVRQEAYEYRDPVTEFLRALYIDFDFEEAQRYLGEVGALLNDDTFMQDSAEAFVEAARHLISESYCKIHQRIDIKDLSSRLGLSQDEGEKWIVNLIRDTRVDAKIDYKAGTVVMNHPPQSVYQQVIERTKGGFFRTQVLSAAVAK